MLRRSPSISQRTCSRWRSRIALVGLSTSAVTRSQLARFLDALPPSAIIVRDACGTAHYWGRRCQARGHVVRLLPAQDVQPYVRRNKTDRADAAALLEAARCDAIQPVAVKTPAQQAVQALHRVGVQWPRTRTARLNAVGGMLRELGFPIPLGARRMMVEAARSLAAAAAA